MSRPRLVVLALLAACGKPVAPPIDGGPPPALDGGDPSSPSIDQGESTVLRVLRNSTHNTFALSASDSDGAAASLTWTITTAPAHGMVSLAGSPSSPGGNVTFQFTPTLDHVGPDLAVVRVDDAEGHTDQITLFIRVEGLAIPFVDVPLATQGVLYTLGLSRINSAGGDQWSIASGVLPPGMVLDGLGPTAMIAGTPMALGSSTFTIEVRDSTMQIAQRTLTIHVNPAGATPPVLNVDNIPAAVSGEKYAVLFDSSGPGNDLRVESGAPPPGVLGMPNDPRGELVVGGRVAMDGFVDSPHSFIVSVTDPSGVANTRRVDLEVRPAGYGPGLQIDTTHLPVATADADYAATLTARGGAGTGFEFSLVAGTLPAGITIANGQLAGHFDAAATPGEVPITIEVRDAAGATARRRLKLFLNAVGTTPLVFGPGLVLPRAWEGRAVQTVFQPTGGTHPYSFDSAGGIVPPAIYHYAQFPFHAIIGAPRIGTSALSTWNLPVVGRDGSGRYGINEYTLDIHPAGSVVIDQGHAVSIAVDVDSPLAGPFNRLRLTASDPDAPASTLVWSVATPPAHGTAQLLSGSPSAEGDPVIFTYGPTSGYVGQDTFVVRVDDGDGHTDETTVTVTVAGTSQTFTWGLVNGGHPIGTQFAEDPWAYGELAFVTASDGALYYTSRAQQSGRYLGRITAAKQWQMLTTSGFTSAATARPISIEGAHSLWGRMTLYPDPDVAGGLLGTVNASTRTGPIGLDVHGAVGFVKFDGAAWRTWIGDATFDRVRLRGLANSHNGVRSFRSAFAFDPQNREGIVLSPRGSVPDVMVAQRLDLDAPSLFGRYDRPPGQTGGWLATPDYDDGDPAYRRSFVIDSNLDTAEFHFSSSRIAHIPGTRDYVFFFNMARQGAPPILGAGRYLAATTAFQWWDGDAWQPAASNVSYAAQIPSVLPGYTATDFADFNLYTTPSEIVLLGVVGTTLKEVRYSFATGQVSAPVDVCTIAAPGQSDQLHFAAHVDGAGALWLVSTPDHFRIDRRRRLANGTWMMPELLYADGRDLSPVGLTEHGGGQLLFVRVVGDDVRLYALADHPATTWASETPISYAALPTVGGLLNTQAGYTFDKAVIVAAPESMGASALGIATDDDGYAYATEVGLADVIVQPPVSMGIDDNHSWGGYWDHFLFPAGVAAYPEGGKVYITSNVHSGGGGTPGHFGLLTAVDLTMRDQSFAYWANVPPLGPQFDPSYGPQQLNLGLYMPVGLAIDRSAGKLYVTSSGTHQISIYDVANTDNSNDPFARADYLHSGFDPSRFGIVDGIVDDLVTAGHLLASGSDLAWVTLTWAPVHASLIATTGYGQLNAGEQAHLHRHMQKHFNLYRDRPVYLGTFGFFGTGPLQFDFPQGLAIDHAHHLYVVDTHNHRVQKIDVSGAPTHLASFGTEGRGVGGQLFYPQSVAASSDGYVFVSDPNNRRIVVFNAAGQYQWEFSQWRDDALVVHDLGANDAGVWAGRPGYLYFSNGGDIVSFLR